GAAGPLRRELRRVPGRAPPDGRLVLELRARGRLTLRRNPTAPASRMLGSSMLRVLVLVAALAAAAAPASLPAPSAAGCEPSPQAAAGPFGRGMPPMRASIGHGHVTTGVVLSALNCKPLAGARVEYWQESPRGGYIRATSGTVVTDSKGR